jgi:hypothetical protein
MSDIKVSYKGKYFNENLRCKNCNHHECLCDKKHQKDKCYRDQRCNEDYHSQKNDCRDHHKCDCCCERGKTGATGPMGNPGNIGATGSSGINGSPGGATGPTGPSGQPGPNGLQGATGPSGPSGLNGQPGTNGLQGSTGPSGTSGPSGLNGQPGPNGLQGATGPSGTSGPSGLNGQPGKNGLQGATGPFGPSGLNGQPGNNGLQGATGPSGSNGTNAVLNFAEFFALMPGDNSATVAPATPVLFPENGPSSSGTTITRLTAGTFNLGVIGTYEIFFQVSVTEPGQLIVVTNSAEVDRTRVGRNTGNTQIVENTLIITDVINTIIQINNPIGNSTALTITPNAGGAGAVSANLVIKQIA